MALDMCKEGDMMWDLLIKNADYVSEHQIEHGNIYVKDGKIAAISAELLLMTHRRRQTAWRLMRKKSSGRSMASMLAI